MVMPLEFHGSQRVLSNNHQNEHQIENVFNMMYDFFDKVFPSIPFSSISMNWVLRNIHQI